MTNLYQCVNAFKSLDSWFLLISVQGELDNFLFVENCLLKNHEYFNLSLSNSKIPGTLIQE